VPSPAASPIGPDSPASPSASPVRPSPSAAPEKPAARGTLKPVGKPRLDAQIRKVVESLDRTGQPPRGVAQGGRRGSQRAVFQNLEGRLPARPPGYYRESDVWPHGPGSRGPERLVLGREGEVYYTHDHYKSFVRLR
jgi:guanyl-specific ribonuclease Sa